MGNNSITDLIPDEEIRKPAPTAPAISQEYTPTYLVTPNKINPFDHPDDKCNGAYSTTHYS